MENWLLGYWYVTNTFRTSNEIISTILEFNNKIINDKIKDKRGAIEIMHIRYDENQNIIATIDFYVLPLGVMVYSKLEVKVLDQVITMNGFKNSERIAKMDNIMFPIIPVSYNFKILPLKGLMRGIKFTMNGENDYDVTDHVALKLTPSQLSEVKEKFINKFINKTYLT